MLLGASENYDSFKRVIINQDDGLICVDTNDLLKVVGRGQSCRYVTFENPIPPQQKTIFPRHFLIGFMSNDDFEFLNCAARPSGER